MSELYETIRRLCAEKGVTPSRMCLDLGWSKSTMSNLKHGRANNLTTSKLSAIAQYLGVSVGDILQETGGRMNNGDTTTSPEPPKPVEKSLEDIKKEITAVRHFDGEPLNDDEIRMFYDALDVTWELVQRKRKRDEKKSNSKSGK